MWRGLYKSWSDFYFYSLFVIYITSLELYRQVTKNYMTNNVWKIKYFLISAWKNIRPPGRMKLKDRRVIIYPFVCLFLVFFFVYLEIKKQLMCKLGRVSITKTATICGYVSPKHTVHNLFHSSLMPWIWVEKLYRWPQMHRSGPRQWNEQHSPLLHYGLGW